MKKSHKHTELSDKHCIVPGCDRKLKKRLVEQKPTLRYCYQCYDKLVLEPRRQNKPTKEEGADAKI